MLDDCAITMEEREKLNVIKVPSRAVQGKMLRFKAHGPRDYICQECGGKVTGHIYYDQTIVYLKNHVCGQPQVIGKNIKQQEAKKVKKMRGGKKRTTHCKQCGAELTEQNRVFNRILRGNTYYKTKCIECDKAQRKDAVGGQETEAKPKRKYTRRAKPAAAPASAASTGVILKPEGTQKIIIELQISVVFKGISHV